MTPDSVSATAAIVLLIIVWRVKLRPVWVHRPRPLNDPKIDGPWTNPSRFEDVA